jgi:hypothetical protein
MRLPLRRSVDVRGPFLGDGRRAGRRALRLRLPASHSDDQVMTVPSHRPLPDDPALATMGPERRAAVALAWRRRARSELSTSTVFADVTRCLVGIGAPHAIVRQAAGAVADEVRHAEICLHVAHAYWPECPAPDPSPVTPPLTTPVGEGSELATVLYVVIQSCLNEGVASAYLQRCLTDATSPLARAAVRDILEDEIHHARLGWSLLASGAMLPAWRAGVAEALPTLLERVADAWTTESDADLPIAPAGHGAIAAREMGSVVRSAYEDLILPGFDRVGIDSRRARAWWAGRSWS